MRQELSLFETLAFTKVHRDHIALSLTQEPIVVFAVSLWRHISLARAAGVALFESSLNVRPALRVIP